MIPDKEKDQHITIDLKINEKMINTASIASADKILEIGGGPGNLTELLARDAQFVYTVEKDEKYFSILSKKFNGSSNVKVIFGNILDIELPKFNKIVSNPPYQILQPFFFRLVKESRQSFECCVMIVPHKFTQIITKKPEMADFGMLSALFFAFYDVEIIATIPKEAFSPKPRVMSHLVKITPKNSDINFLHYIFRSIFWESNKTIRNVILDALWNNGEKLIGRKLTKNRAKQLIDGIDSNKLTSILNKSVLQLSNVEIRALSRSLLNFDKQYQKNKYLFD